MVTKTNPQNKTGLQFFFSTMEVNGAKQLFGPNSSSKYLPLCSAEES